MDSVPVNTAAAVGLILLANGTEIIDLSSIRHAKLEKDRGVLDLQIHGQTAPIRLVGDDAKGLWSELSKIAIPTTALLPAPPVDQPVAGGQAAPQTGQQTASGLAGNQAAVDETAISVDGGDAGGGAATGNPPPGGGTGAGSSPAADASSAAATSGSGSTPAANPSTSASAAKSGPKKTAGQ